MEKRDKGRIDRRSVWDRLLAPVSQPPQREATPTPEEIHESIRCDLEDLFCTRSAWADCLDTLDDPKFEGYLRASVLNYGLPDFSNIQFGPEQLTHELKKAIEEVLARYEPRLIDPDVEVRDASEDTRSMSFSITASIHLGDLGHEVRYQTKIEFDGRVEVEKIGN